MEEPIHSQASWLGSGRSEDGRPSKSQRTERREGEESKVVELTSILS